MKITFEELRQKEVVNLSDGCCFGYVDDVLFDTETRKVISLAVCKRPKFMGFFGFEEGISIGWDEIETVGKDTVIVKTENKTKNFEKKENIFQKILNIFL